MFRVAALSSPPCKRRARRRAVLDWKQDGAVSIKCMGRSCWLVFDMRLRSYAPACSRHCCGQLCPKCLSLGTVYQFCGGIAFEIRQAKYQTCLSVVLRRLGALPSTRCISVLSVVDGSIGISNLSCVVCEWVGALSPTRRVSCVTGRLFRRFDRDIEPYPGGSIGRGRRLNASFVQRGPAPAGFEPFTRASRG